MQNLENRQYAEWETHRACWLAWPSHENLWEENLPLAQAEFTALCQAISLNGTGEVLEILVPDEKAEKAARSRLSGLKANLHRIPYGDIWLRDTAPIFVNDVKTGALSAACFRFNGWGRKYELPFDNEVSTRIGARFSSKHRFDWVFEGGSIEVDGEGTGLTTRQCLLNPNRNPGTSQTKIENDLKKSLGIEKLLWLEDGLLNDHTDGHIDTIARFVSVGKVVCMRESGPNDPNAQVLRKIGSDLRSFKDVRGKPLEVIEIPSPGMVKDEEGEIMPASYVNFYIANRSVIVPQYGTPFDAEAVQALRLLFPGREVMGLPAKAILSGGGAFHCITQQEPLDRRVGKGSSS